MTAVTQIDGKPPFAGHPCVVTAPHWLPFALAQPLVWRPCATRLRDCPSRRPPFIGRTAQAIAPAGVVQCVGAIGGFYDNGGINNNGRWLAHRASPSPADRPRLHAVANIMRTPWKRPELSGTTSRREPKVPSCALDLTATAFRLKSKHTVVYIVL